MIKYYFVGNRKDAVAKVLFTWRLEDPGRRNNFLLGLHAEILVRAVFKYGETFIKRTPSGPLNCPLNGGCQLNRGL